MSFIKNLFTSKGSSKFVTEKAFKANLSKQLSMTPKTLKQLRQYNITDSSMLKLEFFFYGKSEKNSSDLADKLKTLQYSVEHGPSADDPKTLIITGWTTPIKMDESSVLDWTKLMCEIGYEFDCDFDGWGTNPEQ